MTDRQPTVLAWSEARIERIGTVTPTVKSFVLSTGWPAGGRAGQYVDVRLTAPDGYQAQRSYSIASAPRSAPLIEIMVERLEDGEVSSYFHDVAVPGDTIELRGPIGGPFTWGPADGGPLLLVGGGSGIVPLLSMLRARAGAEPACPVMLLCSAPRAADVIARTELLQAAREDALLAVRVHLTREAPPGGEPAYVAGRIDLVAVQAAVARWPGSTPRCFVSGSTGFVGAVADWLVDAGLPPSRIRTERFG